MITAAMCHDRGLRLVHHTATPYAYASTSSFTIWETSTSSATGNWATRYEARVTPANYPYPSINLTYTCWSELLRELDRAQAEVAAAMISRAEVP
jgi:hypothetical protein